MMKTRLLSTVILMGAAQLAFADLRIPSSVFEMSELDEAKAEAQEKKEPLIFVYTDPGTS